MNAETRKLAARDRVLMYTRGMDINPEAGVALALESLRRAGTDAGPDKVMEELFSLLQEKGPQIITDAEGLPLVCAPAMNRRAMVAKDMETLSLTKALRSRLLDLADLFARKRGAGT